jgi:signal transduction histidine kinase/DNA-binding response OmpR family regulator
VFLLSNDYLNKIHRAYHFSASILLIGILLLFPLSIQAEVLLLNQKQQEYAINKHLFLLDNPPSSLTLASLITENSGTYTSIDKWSLAKDLAPVYWGKIQIKNTLSSANIISEWILKFSINWTDIEICVIDKLGQKQFSKSGFFVSYKDRTFKPILKGNQVKLTLLPNETYTIYLKLKCERRNIASQFDMKLLPLETYFEKLNREKEHNSIYLGLVLMMLVYNIILYFFVRDRTYIYYSIYLAAVCAFVSYNTGNLANWLIPSFFPESPKIIHFFKLSFYMGIIGYLAFIRSFLELSKTLSKWDFHFKCLAILAIPSFFLDGFLMNYTNFSYDVADKISLGYSVIFVLSIFLLIFPLLKTKDRKAYFIIFGILAMGSGILLTIWARMQTIEFSTITFRIGSLFEIIAFSLGLAYKQILNEKERQKTRFQLEKSKLIQEQEQKEAERLKELDSLKSRLYTNITHEFRTPLTVIMGMTDQIKQNKRAKELIHRNSHHLLQLINQLLDLAKAEKGQLTLNVKNGNVVDFIKYLTESFLSTAKTKSVHLSFYSELEVLDMDYDENKIQQIIHNLLSNALKFTPKHGQILLYIKMIEKGNRSYLHLSVKDTGIGIPQKDLPFIFDRFYQSDTSSTRGVDGTGIGLALIKELVQLMEGVIEVKSEFGKGSEFSIQLPILNQDSLVIIKNKKPFESQETIIPAPQLEKEEKLHQSIPSKPVLLLVEDNLDITTYIQSFLNNQYKIITAKNGKEGIEKAFEIIPDIIVSDIMMPLKDGFELTQTIKKAAETSHIPIILLTAKADQENKIKGLEYGADAYLMKPFDKNELLIRLKSLIDLRNKLQSHYSKLDLTKKEKIKKLKDKEYAFLKKFHEVIEEHLDKKDFSIPQIAQVLQMSQVQVYRKIKGLTGKTPTQYIRSIRMKKAMHLLQHTNLNISEITYQLGYSDPNYFSRIFQQYFGQTPSSIRKK